VASPTIQPTNSPYTAPVEAQPKAPSRLAFAWMKAEISPAIAPAKMYPAQPAKNWLRLPRALDSWAPASAATKTPVNTISRIALMSLASTVCSDCAELNDQFGQARVFRKKPQASLPAWPFCQST